MNRLGNILGLLGLLITSQIGYSISAQVESELVYQYVSTHSGIAQAEMQRTGVPASIKLAQAMLESNWGQSDLAIQANNHFGIKCGGNWTGGTYYKEDDDRDKDGNLISSCFRSFDNIQHSYIAHSDFLTDPKKSYRYGFLFELESDDYEGWAIGLHKAGYATDPHYPRKLIQIIEKYELYKYDDVGNVGKPIVSTENQTQSSSKNDTTEKTAAESNLDKVKATNTSARQLERGRINSIEIVYGDGKATIYDIAEANRRKPSQLLEFNELFPSEDYVPKKGMVVFLQRKRNSYKSEKKYHIVYEGETMASISHSYGIKLKSLYSKNRMPMGSEPVVGEKLYLYRKASKRNRPKYITDFEDPNADGELLFLDDPDLK